MVYDKLITNIFLPRFFGVRRVSRMEAICWLAVLIVLLLVEIATLGLTTIWFAGGALVACIAALLHASIWIQIVLFLAVSVLL